jgi:uncharacterized membrane protein
MTKLSSGYWQVMDPTNGYFAMHRVACRELAWDKISERYFFESDLLFRLNTIGAVVEDVPIDATYGTEASSLKIYDIILTFIYKHTLNTIKRLFYTYYLRNFSLASLELILGAFLLLFGVLFGITQWWYSLSTGTPGTSGTVMLAALPTMLGVQLMLSFFGQDIASAPRIPLQKRL